VNGNSSSLLACYAFCLVTYSTGAADPVAVDGAAGVTFRQSAATIDVYDFVEVTVTVARPAANPFTDVVVAGEFRCEEAEPVKVDGFCDSQDGSVFRIRFMPARPGSHHGMVQPVADA
jgi:hypothetical protein